MTRPAKITTPHNNHTISTFFHNGDTASAQPDPASPSASEVLLLPSVGNSSPPSPPAPATALPPSPPSPTVTESSTASPTSESSQTSAASPPLEEIDISADSDSAVDDELSSATTEELDEPMSAPVATVAVALSAKAHKKRSTRASHQPHTRQDYVITQISPTLRLQAERGDSATHRKRKKSRGRANAQSATPAAAQEIPLCASSLITAPLVSTAVSPAVVAHTAPLPSPPPQPAPQARPQVDPQVGLRRPTVAPSAQQQEPEWTEATGSRKRQRAVKKRAAQDKAQSQPQQQQPQQQQQRGSSDRRQPARRADPAPASPSLLQQFGVTADSSTSLVLTLRAGAGRTANAAAAWSSLPPPSAKNSRSVTAVARLLSKLQVPAPTLPMLYNQCSTAAELAAHTALNAQQPAAPAASVGAADAANNAAFSYSASTLGSFLIGRAATLLAAAPSSDKLTTWAQLLTPHTSSMYRPSDKRSPATQQQQTTSKYRKLRLDFASPLTCAAVRHHLELAAAELTSKEEADSSAPRVLFDVAPYTRRLIVAQVSGFAVGPTHPGDVDAPRCNSMSELHGNWELLHDFLVRTAPHCTPSQRAHVLSSGKGAVDFVLEETHRHELHALIGAVDSNSGIKLPHSLDISIRRQPPVTVCSTCGARDHRAAACPNKQADGRRSCKWCLTLDHATDGCQVRAQDRKCVLCPDSTGHATLTCKHYRPQFVKVAAVRPTNQRNTFAEAHVAALKGRRWEQPAPAPTAPARSPPQQQQRQQQRQQQQQQGAPPAAAPAAAAHSATPSPTAWPSQGPAASQQTTRWGPAQTAEQYVDNRLDQLFERLAAQQQRLFEQFANFMVKQQSQWMEQMQWNEQRRWQARYEGQQRKETPNGAQPETAAGPPGDRSPHGDPQLTRPTHNSTTSPRQPPAAHNIVNTSMDDGKEDGGRGRPLAMVPTRVCDHAVFHCNTTHNGVCYNNQGTAYTIHTHMPASEPGAPQRRAHRQQRHPPAYGGTPPAHISVNE